MVKEVHTVKYMAKKKILHIISGDLWAGAEVQVYHTVRGLRRSDEMDIEIILFSHGILEKRLEDDGIRATVIDEARNNPFEMITAMARIISDRKPNIIHVHAYKEHIIAKAALQVAKEKISLIRTFHGMSEATKDLGLFKTIKSKIIHAVEKAILNEKNAHLIAVSRDLHEYLSDSYPKASVVQIYNGIPILKDVKESSNDMRTKYRVENEVLWIGTIARLAETKNLPLLVTAATYLKEKNVRFIVSIWGTGPLQDKLEKLIKNEDIGDCIRLEGFDENIYPIIKALDVFVLCSLHEGLPMSLLEAMALSTPVICSNVGGMKEIIEHERTGLLIPSDDADALAKEILRLQGDTELRNEMIERARMHVEKQFNIDNTNKKLVELYESIVKTE